MIGIAISGFSATFLFFPNEQQNTCEQIGGTWNANYCLITQEIFDSNNLTCDPGPVLENNTCNSNGMKLVLDE